MDGSTHQATDRQRPDSVGQADHTITEVYHVTPRHRETTSHGLKTDGVGQTRQRTTG